MPAEMVSTVLWLVIMIGLFYFMLIRPQKKKEKQTKAMLDALKPGDAIITIGGIVGKVLRIREDKVCIEIGDRTHKHPMTIKREAISSVTPCTKKGKGKEVLEDDGNDVETTAETTVEETTEE